MLRSSIWILVVAQLGASAVFGGASETSLETCPSNISTWPSVPDTHPGEAHYVSSYDRTGGNDDGFNGTYSALYVDERGEHVLVDVDGPGCLLTLWFTSRVSGFAPIDLGTLNFYFDDEEKARLSVDANAFFDGDVPPFKPPFVYGPFTSTGGHVSYVPMAFRRRLKITTEKRAGFYNAHYLTYPSDRALESWTPESFEGSVRRLESAWTGAGRDPKPAKPTRSLAGTVALDEPLMPDGEMKTTRAVLVEERGGGVITSFKLNPLFPLSDYQLQNIRLRVFWDGESEPSVDTPLGMFFGSGLGEASVRSLVAGMSESGSYYFYAPMPFWESARIELENETPDKTPRLRWEVEIAEEDAFGYARSRTGYFHARYEQAWPTEAGSDFRLLTSAGDGRYIGQVMTVEPLRPEVKRWWEGDLRIFLGGRLHPSFHGTGHEDEYLGGWSNEWLMNPYSLPWHGEPRTRDLRPVDFQWSAATTVYRFFPSGIPFRNGIRVSTEHGANNTATALYSSVAFYYERKSRFQKLFELDLADEAARKRYRYEARDVRSIAVEARYLLPSDEPTQRMDGESVRDRLTFQLPAVASAHRGLTLRRSFDPTGIQRAEVWVQEKLAGNWSFVDTHLNGRLADADFHIPDSLFPNGQTLNIEIRVTEGDWRTFRYELWGTVVE